MPDRSNFRDITFTSAKCCLDQLEPNISTTRLTLFKLAGGITIQSLPLPISLQLYTYKAPKPGRRRCLNSCDCRSTIGISALINVSTKYHFDMVRSRFPKPWGIAQLVLRSISAGLSFATLIVAIYASTRGHGRAMVGAYIAVCLSSPKPNTRWGKATYVFADIVTLLVHLGYDRGRARNCGAG